MISRLQQAKKLFFSNGLINDESRIVTRLKPYTMCDDLRINNLIKLGKYINSYEIEGDIVECGTYKGGTAAILSQYLGKDRHLWLFDSFEGMPLPTKLDGAEATRWSGQCRATVNDVYDAMDLVSTPNEKFTIRKGWFEQTFRETLPSKVALLHCDADWYDSVTRVLETFYDLIPDGGCVILDDFGYWEGCREAFYNFCSKYNHRPLLERVGDTQAWWIKGRIANRS